jgi:hypothetical protein
MQKRSWIDMWRACQLLMSRSPEVFARDGFAGEKMRGLT